MRLSFSLFSSLLSSLLSSFSFSSSSSSSSDLSSGGSLNSSSFVSSSEGKLKFSNLVDADLIRKSFNLSFSFFRNEKASRSSNTWRYVLCL